MRRRKDEEEEKKKERERERREGQLDFGGKQSATGLDGMFVSFAFMPQADTYIYPVQWPALSIASGNKTTRQILPLTEVAEYVFSTTVT